MVQLTISRLVKLSFNLNSTTTIHFHAMTSFCGRTCSISFPVQQNDNWILKKKFSTSTIDKDSDDSTLSQYDKSNIELQIKIVRHLYPSSLWQKKKDKESLMSHRLMDNLKNIHHIQKQNFLGISKEKIARRVYFLYKQNPSIYQHLSVDKVKDMIQYINDGKYTISPCEIKEYDYLKYQRSFNIINNIIKFEGRQFIFSYSAGDILLQDALFSLVQEGILYVFDIPAHMHSASKPLLDRECLKIFGKNLRQNQDKFASNVISKLRKYDSINDGLIIDFSAFLMHDRIPMQYNQYLEYMEEHYYHPLKLFLDLFISDPYIISLLLSFMKNLLIFDNQLLMFFELSTESFEENTLLIELLFREHYFSSFPLLLLLQNLRFYLFDIDIFSILSYKKSILYTRYNSEVIILFDPSFSDKLVDLKIMDIQNIIHKLNPNAIFYVLESKLDKSACFPFLGKQVYLNQTGSLTLSTDTDAKSTDADAKKENAIKEAIKDAKKNKRKKKK